MIHKIKTVVEVTDQDIDDIMCGALEGGVNYWCGEARLTDDNKLPEDVEWLHEGLTRGLDIELYDFEDEKWYTLTLAKMLKALSNYTKITGQPLDVEQFDANSYDSLVQIALFGEVTYG